MSRSIGLLGGMDHFVKPGEKVLLKCNLLMKKSPEEATTTHPEVAAAVARLVREAGAVPVLADSPSGLFNVHALRVVYRGCGMEKIARRDHVALNENVGETEVFHPEGKIIRSLTVMEILQEVDAVIDIAKLKTHGMTIYTGAVKNLFGVIPGTAKAEYHLRMKRLEDFSNMLVDICTYVKPVLSVMDAVVGMEGQGPSAGDPRKIGAILASESPFALDVAACSMVGIDPDAVCTIQRARERGLCSSRLQDLTLLGDPMEDLLVRDFRIPEHKHVGMVEQYFGKDSRIGRFINFHFGPRPVFLQEGCIGCGNCAGNCPPKAITMVNHRPEVDLKKCIRCYCCQELCPQKTVAIKRSWLFRIFQ
ncbi:DUF362 domain-containing protein [Eubacteriales bacterium mix99]